MPEGRPTSLPNNELTEEAKMSKLRSLFGKLLADIEPVKIGDSNNDPTGDKAVLESAYYRLIGFFYGAQLKQEGKLEAVLGGQQSPQIIEQHNEKPRSFLNRILHRRSNDKTKQKPHPINNEVVNEWIPLDDLFVSDKQKLLNRMHTQISTFVENSRSLLQDSQLNDDTLLQLKTLLVDQLLEASQSTLGDQRLKNSNPNPNPVHLFDPNLLNDINTKLKLNPELGLLKKINGEIV